MERISVRSHFHTAHRQLDYPGHCINVHGHTWRGKVTVECDEFPRDTIDVSLDFGHLKAVMRRLDHKILVSEDDETFQNSELFSPEGVIVLKGRGPSVENVSKYIWDGVVAYIRSKFPGRGIDYKISVEVQETDNNYFLLEKSERI
jgi:6-pyruvoyltetrahydropterin/6-carboxytetrahydropterin synthase